MRTEIVSLLMVMSISLISTAGKGEYCHLFNWCSGDLYCHFYRCYSLEEWNLIKHEIKFTPKGKVCDIFHWCPDGFKCKKGICLKNLENTKDKKGLLQQAKEDNQKQNKTDHHELTHKQNETEHNELAQNQNETEYHELTQKQNETEHHEITQKQNETEHNELAQNQNKTEQNETTKNATV